MTLTNRGQHHEKATVAIVVGQIKIDGSHPGIRSPTKDPDNRYHALMAGSWQLWVGSYWHAVHIIEWHARHEPEHAKSSVQFRRSLTGLVTAAIEVAAADKGIHVCCIPADLGSVPLSAIVLGEGLLFGGGDITDFAYWPPPGEMNPLGDMTRNIQELSATPAALRTVACAASRVIESVGSACRPPGGEVPTLDDTATLWPAADTRIELRAYAIGLADREG
ncbi:hypothetical protein [Nocardia sp. NBC_01388]|uniref:hypothetical protein n=1 Tax=Nocardia sp. NBC_01388 TaxID=2903596 RepID=UPI0032558083